MAPIERILVFCLDARRRGGRLRGADPCRADRAPGRAGRVARLRRARVSSGPRRHSRARAAAIGSRRRRSGSRGRQLGEDGGAGLRAPAPGRPAAPRVDRDLQALRGPRGRARRPRRARDGARRCVRRGFRARSAGADARRLRRDRRACRAGRDRRDAGAGRSGLRGRRAAGRGGGRAGASRREPGFSIMLDTHQLEVVEPSFEEGFAAAEGRASHIHLYDPGTGRREWRRSGSTGTGSGPRCSATASVAPDRWCWRPRATATPRRGRRSPSCGRR